MANCRPNSSGAASPVASFVRHAIGPKRPNQDRAKILLDALRDEKDDIALIGISNEGLFMPLVAAARPIRRIVMLNAVMPFPGKSFWQATQDQQVWANWATRLLARIAPGMSEVCPLSALPQTEYVYICGADDDAINPAWEQWAAREYLHVDPIVIPERQTLRYHLLCPRSRRRRDARPHTDQSAPARPSPGATESST